MPPAAPKHICPCSKCHGGSKRLTKRTIELHLQQDQEYFQSLSSDRDIAILVQSCITQTIQLLSQLHGDPILPDTEPDADGSHPDGSERPEGVLLAL
jgi:hypothetical protein